MNPAPFFPPLFQMYFFNLSKSEFRIFTLSLIVIWQVVKISLPAILCFVDGRHILHHSDSFTSVKILNCRYFTAISHDSYLLLYDYCFLSHKKKEFYLPIMLVFSLTPQVSGRRKNRELSYPVRFGPSFFISLLHLMLSDELWKYFHLKIGHNLVKK